jgi:hypothetical protein
MLRRVAEHGEIVSLKTDIFFSNCQVPSNYFNLRSTSQSTVSARQQALKKFKELMEQRHLGSITTPSTGDWLKLKLKQRSRLQSSEQQRFETIKDEMARR